MIYDVRAYANRHVMQYWATGKPGVAKGKVFLFLYCKRRVTLGVLSFKIGNGDLVRILSIP
jgi:hypothetical protein